MRLGGVGATVLLAGAMAVAGLYFSWDAVSSVLQPKPVMAGVRKPLFPVEASADSPTPAEQAAARERLRVALHGNLVAEAPLEPAPASVRHAAVDAVPPIDKDGAAGAGARHRPGWRRHAHPRGTGESCVRQAGARHPADRRQPHLGRFPHRRTAPASAGALWHAARPDTSRPDVRISACARRRSRSRRPPAGPTSRCRRRMPCPRSSGSPATTRSRSTPGEDDDLRQRPAGELRDDRDRGAAPAGRRHDRRQARWRGGDQLRSRVAEDRAGRHPPAADARRDREGARDFDHDHRPRAGQRRQRRDLQQAERHHLQQHRLPGRAGELCQQVQQQAVGQRSACGSIRRSSFCRSAPTRRRTTAST